MRKIDLGQAISMLANLGVIAGIIFLSFELRQNTTQMQAEASLGVNQQFQQIIEAQYLDRDFTELIMRGEREYLSLDPVDQRRVQKLFLSQLNLIDVVSIMEEEGLPDISIKIVEIYIEECQSMPGRRRFIISTTGRAKDV